MIGSKRTRAIALGIALLITVVASVWPRAQDSAPTDVVPAVKSRESPPAQQAAAAVAPENPALPSRAERPHSKSGDLFGPKSWDPPPPPVKRAPPPPPPAPTAPAFPYAVSGSVADANGVMVVFSNQQQNFVVRVGEVLDKTYRVESVDAQSVTLTYLPLGLTQRVPLSAMN